MARRPVFVASTDDVRLVATHYVEFEWFSGMAASQVRKSIASLHRAACKQLRVPEVLEISSKSEHPTGVEASSFNLTIHTPKHDREFSVECAYQSSKVFERGGPYIDLLGKESRQAKRDPRLSHSGCLVEYKFFGQDWKLEPKTAFYDWLYMNALIRHPPLASRILKFSAFSDIAFNPERSINCQAHAAALFVALHERGMLEIALSDRARYLEIIRATRSDDPGEGVPLQEGIRFD